MNMKNLYPNEYILKALEIAEQSGNDVPVGAILVKNNEIISFSSNEKEKNQDPTAHAEMIVIQKAANKLGRWRLNDVVLYVTLEPCPMCAAAILYSRIPLVYFGAYDPLYGAFGSSIDMRQYIKFNTEIIGGVEESNCSKLLKQYFQAQRIHKE